MSYKSPTSKRKKRSCLRGLGCLSFTVGLLGVVAFLAFCGYYMFRASKFDIEDVAIMPERTVILDRNGLELGKIHGENRTVVPIEEISRNFRMSILAREDARFYDHGGIDYKGLARATVRNIKDRRMTQGASTITMQLARNSFDLSQGEEWYHELDRKFLEIFVAKKIERNYEKQKILEFYCNRIFWGHSMLGIESASQAYLGKPAKDLTLSEGAMLAGIVRGPNAFSPFRSIKLATRERDTVLDRLVYYSLITKEEADKAKAEPLKISSRKSASRKQSYALDAISRELTYHLTKNNVKVGGLTIHTTLDKNLQQTAEDSINNRLQAIESLTGYKHQTRATYRRSGSKEDPAYIQGALVCIDNKTGGIVATVGGRSAEESRFNRAYYARRQIGSIFKPFVFQAAFDRGLRPQTLMDDAALKSGEIDHAKSNWNPRNSDGKFKGLIATREALLNSRNTSSVRVGDFAQMHHVQRAAEYAGFDLFQPSARTQGKTPKDATSYLGTWEASPEEVARAYTIFPNNGIYKQPFLISKIVQRDGKTLKLGGLWAEDDRLSVGSTYEVTKILEDINVRGTGKTLRSKYGFTAPSAGKTGTTDDYKDAWYAGYTSELTCAVWVGLDTPKRTINGGYGSTLALPIWADVMKAAAQKSEFKPQALMKNVRTTPLLMCSRSARKANDRCVSYNSAYQDTVPNDLLNFVNRPCTIHLTNSNIVQRDAAPQRAVIVEPSGSARSERERGGFFDRLFGKKEERPKRAIVVEEDATFQNFPDPQKPPPRAIVVEDAPRAPVRKPVLVKPARNPNPVPRAVVIDSPPVKQPVPPSRQRQPAVTQPPRAIVIEPNSPRSVRPTRPVTQPTQPVPRRAVVVEDPSPAPAPPEKAVVVEEPAPPRAVIVEEPPVKPPRAIIVE